MSNKCSFPNKPQHHILLIARFICFPSQNSRKHFLSVFQKLSAAFAKGSPYIIAQT